MNADRIIIVDIEQRLPYDHVDQRVAETHAAIGRETESELKDRKAGLLELLNDVNDTTRKIRTSVQKAKRAFAAGDGASDRDWLFRAERAAGHYGRSSQRIAQAVAAINHELKRRHVAEPAPQASPDASNRVLRAWLTMGYELGFLKRASDGHHEVVRPVCPVCPDPGAQTDPPGHGGAADAAASTVPTDPATLFFTGSQAQDGSTSSPACAQAVPEAITTGATGATNEGGSDGRRHDAAGAAVGPSGGPPTAVGRDHRLPVPERDVRRGAVVDEVGCGHGVLAVAGPDVGGDGVGTVAVGLAERHPLGGHAAPRWPLDGAGEACDAGAPSELGSRVRLDDPRPAGSVGSPDAPGSGSGTGCARRVPG